MRYIEYKLTDRGYHVAALDGPGEIFGLDNRIVDDDGFEDDQRFWHLGIDGYPQGALCCLDAPGQMKTKTLAIFADGVTPPTGGTEILVANLVVLLVAEYGWPEGSRLVDGMPTGPANS
jgi:hypothetical protein